jgi:hypothetical protein
MHALHCTYTTAEPLILNKILQSVLMRYTYKHSCESYCCHFQAYFKQCRYGYILYISKIEVTLIINDINYRIPSQSIRYSSRHSVQSRTTVHRAGLMHCKTSSSGSRLVVNSAETTSNEHMYGKAC